ncbi:hypothetical protein BRETT_003112 [Brettanomyces bruxellensis]|uniref:Sec1-like protein n=1 Tax=Dekkera bruxellensis TaxID=5007 RepID=A0A871R8W0_DEKBR|nr:uncharacterized protein BRETT_003112 [Brettanomyces bruxellensis]QOU22923.1 hypothetical protein BRETT_003112 [Brettanomyces bruxellensis]
MLHLNIQMDDSPVSSTSKEELTWKVLVLDRRSTAIVSSVLRVNDLLDYGITMHALIDQRRTSLPDVNAVYFVSPTVENIAKIISDVNNDHYAKFYVNFTSSLGRSLLEDFAKKVAETGNSYKIKQVYDQYLDFIVTEPNLFSLDMKNVYAQFYDPKTVEDEISGRVNEIVSGLFSAVLTMGSVPIIRSNRGGPAELIAQKLDHRLRDHSINTKQALRSPGVNSANNSIRNNKSVLILLDRNIDLASMFAHSWIYQCMVKDVFKLERNTIQIETKSDNGETSLKRYDIDPHDFFWNENASLPFPDAVEHVEAELSKYTEEAKEISSKTGYSSIKDINPNDGSDTKHIQEAIKALPELTKRKNIIDMHMSVLTELIKELEAKNLDSFFEVEQNITDPKVQTQFLDLMKKDTKGDNSKDKLRTYIIMYLKCELPETFCSECEEILKASGLDLKALAYIKRVKELNKMSAVSTLDAQNMKKGQGSAFGNGSALFSGLSSKLVGITSEGSSKLSEGLGSLISGIKKLMPEKSNLPITNIVEAILTPQQANQASLDMTDDYLYFDPSSTRGAHAKPPRRSSYDEAMVFVVGGGNYLEYSNLQDWCNGLNSSSVEDQQRTIIYGSTKICSVDGFLEECSSLGDRN